MNVDLSAFGKQVKQFCYLAGNVFGRYLEFFFVAYALFNSSHYSIYLNKTKIPL